MGFELAFWHWIVLGVGLLLLEMALPSFMALWFGVAAILVGLIKAIMPDVSFNALIVTWTVLSIILTWSWFKYLRPLSVDRTKAGLSREAIVGELGQVLTVPTEDRRGVLRFTTPILGADEWQFISNDELEIGERVRVSDISGNALIVTKS